MLISMPCIHTFASACQVRKQPNTANPQHPSLPEEALADTVDPVALAEFRWSGLQHGSFLLEGTQFYHPQLLIPLPDISMCGNNTAPFDHI